MQNAPRQISWNSPGDAGLFYTSPQSYASQHIRGLVMAAFDSFCILCHPIGCGLG